MKSCICSLALILAASSFAAADELDRFRQQDQLLSQKWSRDVGAALETSQRLERTNPAAARETIENALGSLKTAPGLNDAVRADLTRRLQSRLATIPATTIAQGQRPLTPPRPTGVAPASGGGTSIPSTFAPSNPPAGGVSNTAKSIFDQQQKNLGKFSETRDNGANAFNGAIQGVQGAAIPVDREMTFSPNHKQLSERRAPKLNEKEETVMKALGSTIDGDFTGMNFRQALDYIHQKSGLLIIPDAGSLKEANVEYDDPVNFKINAKIAVRTALKKLLADRGLSYVITEGGVNVVTVQKARETTVVRVYSVRDLVTPLQPQPQYVIGPFGGLFPVAPNTFPPGTPGVTPSFSQQMGAQIAEMVRTSVDPTYWGPSGPGTIAYNDLTGSLVVRASAEVHFMVGGALYGR